MSGAAPPCCAPSLQVSFGVPDSTNLQKACDDHKNGVWAAGGDPLEGLASPLEDQEIDDVAGDYNHAEPEPEDDGQTA